MKSRHQRNRAAAGLEWLESRVLLTVTVYGFSSVVSFDASTKVQGSDPNSLVMDVAGNIFGTTATGGSKGYGTVFEIATGTSVVTTLASFTGLNGYSPNGKLVLDSSGNLFGVAANGGLNNDGTIWELASGGSTISALASFNVTNGSHPFGGLTADTSGNLFGTTILGGNSNAGTVFEVASGASTITVLGSFNGTNGSSSTGSLVVDSGGNIFGTAFSGGDKSVGTVFEVVSGSGTITKLASFGTTNTMGTNPTGTLLMDSGGNLFGITSSGGTANLGTVFEVAFGTTTISTLASFTGTQGQHPVGSVVMDGDGNLFGTTASGGTNSNGAAFELVSGDSTITNLVSFTTEAMGIHPSGGLVMDGDGNLFGTTFNGGTVNNGTIFELTPGGAAVVQTAVTKQSIPVITTPIVTPPVVQKTVTVTPPVAPPPTHGHTATPLTTTVTTIPPVVPKVVPPTVPQFTLPPIVVPPPTVKTAPLPSHHH